MKVCHIATFSQKSGIGLYALDLVKHMPNATIHDWQYKTRISRILGPLLSFFSLRSACKANDIVHIQYHIGEYGPLFLPIMGLIKGKCKIVLTLHETHKEMPRLVRYLHWAYGCADMLFVHTNLHRAFLPDKLRRITKVIHMGIRKVNHSVIRGSKTRILMPGFINRWKGIDVGIKAFKQLDNAQLVIMGKVCNKQYYDHIWALANDDPQRDITFKTGFADDKTYDEEFRSADIILLPYKSITMSAILADAMAYHKLIVASDIPEFKEYLHGLCPLARVDDPNDTAEKIREVLADRQNITEQIKLQAETFSWKNIAHRTIEDYAMLL